MGPTLIFFIIKSPNKIHFLMGEMEAMVLTELVTSSQFSEPSLWCGALPPSHQQTLTDIVWCITTNPLLIHHFLFSRLIQQHRTPTDIERHPKTNQLGVKFRLSIHIQNVSNLNWIFSCPILGIFSLPFQIFTQHLLPPLKCCSFSKVTLVTQVPNTMDASSKTIPNLERVPINSYQIYLA